MRHYKVDLTEELIRPYTSDAVIVGSIRFSDVDGIALGSANGIVIGRLYEKRVFEHRSLPLFWYLTALMFRMVNFPDHMTKIYLN